MHYELKQADGSWAELDWAAPYVIGTYADGSRKLDYDKYFRDEHCIGRNYELFAVLADVRNFGWGGDVDYADGDKRTPIAAPRGLPDDVSTEVRKDSDSWDCDGHSHSWFTLRELLEYDWNQTSTSRGIVNEAEFRVFEREGKPNGWCGGVGGRGVVHVTNSAMRSIVAGTLPRKTEATYYTLVEWQETYRNAIGEHWFKLLDLLKDRHGIDNVRLVFWFDN